MATCKEDVKKKEIPTPFETFSITRGNGEIKLKKDQKTVDEAILWALIDGLELISDQNKYSHDGFKKYTEKWQIKP